MTVNPVPNPESVNTKQAPASYKICSRCVMDTSDPEITFDDQGICNHCKYYEEHAEGRLLSGQAAQQALDALVTQIKSESKNREYDCVVGISGGVDSTYLAYKIKKLGLRVLAVHFDNGWNSELAVSNIEKVLNKLDIDLYTYVVDWPEFKDIQLSFLKASTPDSEIPTDHAIFAALMQIAVKHKVKNVMVGTNFRTEGIYIESWGYGHNDSYYIKQIQKKFGTKKIKSFPYYSVLDLAYYFGIKRLRFISLLNYLEYDKKQAVAELEQELGWRNYEGKHHESVYTRFFQSYILPRKFGIDKRRSHLSALIYSSEGKFTREMAMKELEKEICSKNLLNQDKEFAIKKLGLTELEFERIMQLPVRSFKDYKSNYKMVRGLKKLQNTLKSLGVFHK